MYSLHDIEIKDVCLSDHFIISFVTNVSKPKCDEQSVTSRNVSQINPIDFKNKLSSILSKDPRRNIDSLNSALSTLLEETATMRRRTVKPRPPAPWLTPQVKAAKQERRKAERQWKKSGLTVHRDIYRLKHQFACNLIKDLKRKFVNDKIVESRSSKEIFNICNDLLGKKQT
ncbi:ATP-dependent DNA helicase [Elysia marginata]|uniref:ATP-dependent DNA helicase n=1 Tax=Elysia marginata TaxID=1093978 RepID=A0AAV4H203_9GAST|nr:ATP-dependent DNA helicase [Elysia marginata]